MLEHTGAGGERARATDDAQFGVADDDQVVDGIHEPGQLALGTNGLMEEHDVLERCRELPAE